MRRSAAKRPEEIVIHLEIVLPLPNAVAFGTREKEFLQLVARFVSRFIVGKSRLVVAPPFVGERKLDSGEHLPALFVDQPEQSVRRTAIAKAVDVCCQ